MVRFAAFVFVFLSAKRVCCFSLIRSDTLLHVAAREGSRKCAQYLLSQEGIDPAIKNRAMESAKDVAKDQKIKNDIQLQSKNSPSTFFPVVAFLLKLVCFRIVDGMSLLKCAENNHVEKFKKLVEEKDTLGLDFCNFSKVTALHFACTKGHLEIATILIAQTSEDIPLLDNANNQGCRPIHVAIENRQLDCVKMLAVAGADLNVRTVGYSSSSYLSVPNFPILLFLE